MKIIFKVLIHDFNKLEKLFYISSFVLLFIFGFCSYFMLTDNRPINQLPIEAHQSDEGIF